MTQLGSLLRPVAFGLAVLTISCSGSAQSNPSTALANQLVAEWGLEPFALVKFYSPSTEILGRPDSLVIVIARQHSWTTHEQRIAMHAVLSGVPSVLAAASKATDAWFDGCYAGARVSQYGDARRAVINALGADKDAQYFPLLASRAGAAGSEARLKMDPGTGAISPSFATALIALERSLNERLTPEAALAFVRLRVPGCSAPAYVDALNQLEVVVLQAVSASTAELVTSASAPLKEAADSGLKNSREGLRQRLLTATRTAAPAAAPASTNAPVQQIRALRDAAAKSLHSTNR